MKTPLFVTFVFFSVLITGSGHLIGVIETLRRWGTLESLLGNVVYYVFISNLALCLAAIGVLLAVWFRLRRARWYVLGYVLLFIFLYWFDRLVVFRTYSFTRIPFGIAFQIVIGIVLYVGFSRKSVKAYFGEINA
ncbi:MAG: hypothetical protein N3D16_00810 [Anaerolineales bacterium]|nr:hypothetical protein [Anaerolineales bacterium]